MVFFAQGAAKAAHRGLTVLKRLRTFVQAPEDTNESLNYPKALPQRLFGDFSQFMQSAISAATKLPEEDSQYLLNFTIYVGDEQRDRIDRDTERARYASTRGLMIEFLKNSGS